LSAGTVLADRVAEPRAPQDKTLSGTLKWENVKRPDGSTVKGRLYLITGDRKITLPVTSRGKIITTKPGTSIDVTHLAGKQVKVLARVAGNRSTMKILAVTRIQEDASGPVATRRFEPAGTKAR